MPNRSRKDEIRRKKHQKRTPPTSKCPFCHVKPEEVIETGTYFRVFMTLFKYTYWDEQNVVDQLLLVPKQHVESLSKLPPKAAEEFMELLGKYESQGYSLYARTPDATSKTVPHQHTHLIQVTGKSKKFMFHLRRPYILIVR
jgi:diadenosine tetraphosphate (Ap4A) HIT family hydrolase